MDGRGRGGALRRSTRRRSSRSRLPRALFDGTRLQDRAPRRRARAEHGRAAPPWPSAALELRPPARRRRSAARRAAGLALAASGTWPTAVPEEQAVTPEPGYLAVRRVRGPVGAAAVLLRPPRPRRGRDRPRPAWSALEAVLPWLPLVLARLGELALPRGRGDGPRLERAAELLALLPRSGAPPVFASYAEWARFAERLVELGLADSYTRIWWDVAPAPRSSGRSRSAMPDQPTRARGHGRLRRAPPGARRRRGGDGRPPTGGSTPRTAGPRSASARGASSSIRTAERLSPAPELLRRARRARSARRPSGSARPSCSHRSTASRRPTSSSSSAAARGCEPLRAPGRPLT